MLAALDTTGHSGAHFKHGKTAQGVRKRQLSPGALLSPEESGIFGFSQTQASWQGTGQDSPDEQHCPQSTQGVCQLCVQVIEGPEAVLCKMLVHLVSGC